MKKRLITMVLAGMTLVAGLAGCSSSDIYYDPVKDTLEEAEVQVFLDDGLSKVMEKLAEDFNKEHPNVTITYTADSSANLVSQIEEGSACDLFFSLTEEDMDQLEEDGMLVDGTRADVVNNKLALACRYEAYYEDVKRLADVNAERVDSMALANGNVPVGKVTRQALVNIGILPETEDVSQITKEEVSEALGHLKMTEEDSASGVVEAIAGRSVSMGTIYESDIYGYEGELRIIDRVSRDVTGDLLHPIARVVNKDADDAENAAADAFLEYVCSDKAKKVFEKYHFDTDLSK